MIRTNLNQGSYLPHFFNNPAFNLSEVNFTSEEKSENGGLNILLGKHSFTYLRDTIRHIDAFDLDGNMVPFDRFLDTIKIKINSQNLFKTGKYLSRVFRPVKYGAHLPKLSVYINSNYDLSLVDGITLVSKRLTKMAGWNAKTGESAQFTLFYKDGFVKGHCIITDKIKSDVVIYNGNIKTDIQFFGGYYIAFEPVKLKRGVVLDIQTLLNLYDLFGGEQYFQWFVETVNKFKTDFANGILNDWLYNEDDEDTDFTLQRAISAGIDYRRYPGLIRSGWSMFYKSLVRIASKKNGNPDFRIPIDFGYRGYLRVDLRFHDCYGNFQNRTQSACLDKYGNFWINSELVEKMFKILGGADQDDNVAIIPVAKDKAVIYRNPNQFGEFQVIDLEYDGINVKNFAKLIGSIPTKQIKAENNNSSGNEFLSKMHNIYLNMYKPSMDSGIVEYNTLWLAKTLTKILYNDSHIGLAANAEMIMVSLRLLDDYGKKLFMELKSKFNWNLEKIIDSTVKDAEDVSSEIETIRAFYDYCVENEIPVPLCLAHRAPEKYRDKLSYIEDNLHPLDELYKALKQIIEMVNEEILGKGTGALRIKGCIDFCQPEIDKVARMFPQNEYKTRALELFHEYNSKVAKILSEDIETDELKNDLIKQVQREIADKLEELDEEAIMKIIQVWMLKIYLSEKAIHDSILWNKHIAPYTIKLLVLANSTEEISEKACCIEQSLSTQHPATEKKEMQTQEVKAIRVWHPEPILADQLQGIQKMLVENRNVKLGEKSLFLGDECSLANGEYKVVLIRQALSKVTGKPLNHSIVINYLP